MKQEANYVKRVVFFIIQKTWRLERKEYSSFVQIAVFVRTKDRCTKKFQKARDNGRLREDFSSSCFGTDYFFS